MVELDGESLTRRLHRAVVGRRRETEILLAALLADRHVLLEGPPGTGKSTLLRAVAEGLGVGFELVEGNAELTPARLVGHHDPSRLLTEGYAPEIFVEGPLLSAMTAGSLLYIEEINRVPEETLNVLITVMSEGELNVPRLGRTPAQPGFRLVAAMNPFDAVGTARISSAIYDRTCRLVMDYQDPDEEAEIVARHLDSLDRDWLAGVVEVVRLTRSHPDVRVGSSVRGAVDTVLVAASLGRLRAAPMTSRTVGLDAAAVALSGRIRLQDGCDRTAESVIQELWDRVFPVEEVLDAGPERAAPLPAPPAGSGPGKVRGPLG
jgi:MoxR-like ATPase